MNFEEERGKRRQRLIAQAWHVSKALIEASEFIRVQIEKTKNHELSEWELAETTQQEVLQLFVECGLTELMEKAVAFALVNQAMSYVDQKVTT